MILIVTYDLKVVRDYTPLYEALKLQGHWWHYLASTWLIDTSKTPQQVWEAVQPHLDQRDFILIAEMGQQHQGWLPKDAWEWITSRSTQTSFQFNRGFGGFGPPYIPPSQQGR